MIYSVVLYELLTNSLHTWILGRNVKEYCVLPCKYVRDSISIISHRAKSSPTCKMVWIFSNINFICLIVWSLKVEVSHWMSHKLWQSKVGATWLVESLHGSLNISLRKALSTPKYWETTYRQKRWRSMPLPVIASLYPCWCAFDALSSNLIFSDVWYWLESRQFLTNYFAFITNHYIFVVHGIDKFTRLPCARSNCFCPSLSKEAGHGSLIS